MTWAVIVNAWMPTTSCSNRMNDPDPKVRAWAELQLIGQIFGSNFVERWLEWNGFEDELREWRAGGFARGGAPSLPGVRPTEPRDGRR